MKILRIGGFAALFGIFAAIAQAKDQIVVGLPLEPPHLDPTSAAASAIDQVLYANVFEGLTRFGPDGAVLPGLAESWKISADGTVYLVRLRAGVTFHDGTEMDAKDVKFTLDRARDETSQNAQKALFEVIDTVDVVTPLVLKVTLKAPEGNFLFNLAWGDAVIVAPESIGDIKQKPVGTGAFKFANWVQGERIELERYADYWGEPARLETAVFQFINEPADASEAMLAGEVNAYPAFPKPEELPQFEADPRFQVLVGSTEGETILGINNQLPPFDNLRVRRAITHAIDRQAVLDAATAGLGTPIATHFAPHHPDYIDLTANSPYDPALAIQLLTEAGYESGFETTLKLPPPPYIRRSGDVIATQLRTVGIEVEIIHLEWADWLEDVFRGKNFGLTLITHTEPFDIGIYARPDFYFQYDSVTFRAVMDALNLEQDAEKRSAWLAAAQRVISENYVNGFLFQMPAITVADSRLRGLWRHTPIQATDLTGVYWEE